MQRVFLGRSMPELYDGIMVVEFLCENHVSFMKNSGEYVCFANCTKDVRKKYPFRHKTFIFSLLE